MIMSLGFLRQFQASKIKYICLLYRSTALGEAECNSANAEKLPDSQAESFRLNAAGLAIFKRRKRQERRLS